MPMFTWNRGQGSYSDPAQWTPVGVPLYGADTTATIDSGTATLSDAEPDGLTLSLGGPDGASLVLDNAAIGPDMVLDTVGAAVLGIEGYDTNFGLIDVGGTLAIPINGQFNQNGTIDVTASGTLDAGPGGSGTLDNAGLVDFIGGSGLFEGAITGTGTVRVEGGSTVSVDEPVTAGQSFEVNHGSLSISSESTFKGRLAGLSDPAASLLLGGINFNSAAVVQAGPNEYLAVANNGQTTATIPFSGSGTASYSVSAPDAAGLRTITPLVPASPQTFTDGSIPSVISTGTVTIQNAEPNGQSVQLSNSNPNTQPELILDNAALGPQLTLSFISPAGFAFASYATIGIEGYDTINNTLYIGGRPLTPQFLTIALGPHSQLNLNGTINVFDASKLLVQEDDPAAPGCFNNDGLVNLGGSNAVITPDVIGTGTFEMNVISNVGSSTLEFGGAVSAGQTIVVNDGGLILDNPSKFAGTLASFTGFETALVLQGVQADAAQYQAISPGVGKLLLTAGGATVASFALDGPGASAYDVAYSAATSVTTVRLHSGP